MSCSESRTVTNSTGTVFETLARSQVSTSAPDTSGTCQSSMKRSKLSRPACFMASRPESQACTSWPSSAIQRLRSASWSGSSSRIAIRTRASAGGNDTGDRTMRVALLGAGTIARLVLESAARGALPGIEFVALAGRGPASRGADLGREFGVPFVVGRDALLACRPQAVLEAASHDAVREHLVALLDAGVA